MLPCVKQRFLTQCHQNHDLNIVYNLTSCTLKPIFVKLQLEKKYEQYEQKIIFTSFEIKGNKKHLSALTNTL